MPTSAPRCGWTSSSAFPAGTTCRRSPVPRQGPASTCNWTPAWAATAPSPRSGPAVPSRPAGRASRAWCASSASWATCPAPTARPRRPTRWAGTGSPGGCGVARAAGLRPADRHLAATAATLSDPLAHHTMSRIGAGLVGIDESRHGGAAARPDPDRAAGERPQRAGRHRGRLRAHLDRPARRPGSACSRSGTPTACPGWPPAAPRSGRRHAPPGGRPDLHGHDRRRSRRRPAPSRRRRRPSSARATHGEPTVAEWAGWADTLEHEIVTGLGARVHRVGTRLHDLRRTRVAVIGGGRNCEHDVSLASAAAVADALDQAGYDVVA